MANEKLKFTCDYMEGAHPLIMDALLSTNMMQTSGYGLDEFSASARDKIRKACDAPDAGVYFLVGGTQTNATVIDALLRSYQGVLCAETGHIAVHEAGAISRCHIHTERSQPHRSPLIWIPSYPMKTMSTWSCPAWSISHSRLNTGRCIPWKN